MTQLQLTLIHQREVWLERTLTSLFILSQIACITLIYLHDSQGSFIPLAIMSTFLKSVVIGAITIELLRITDRLIKKYWLYAAMKSNRTLEYIS